MSSHFTISTSTLPDSQIAPTDFDKRRIVKRTVSPADLGGCNQIVYSARDPESSVHSI